MPLIRPATLADCEYMAPRLRAADMAEMKALDGSEPLPALIESFTASRMVNVMEHDGVPFAIYGVAPDLNGGYNPVPDRCSHSTLGISWMLGTDDLARHSRWFLRNCGGMLDEMHGHFPTFYNFADERNEVHIRWLRWAGFTFGRRIPHNGTHFWEHWRTKECV